MLAFLKKIPANQITWYSASSYQLPSTPPREAKTNPLASYRPFLPSLNHFQFDMNQPNSIRTELLSMLASAVKRYYISQTCKPVNNNLQEFFHKFVPAPFRSTTAPWKRSLGRLSRPGSRRNSQTSPQEEHDRQ